MIKTGIVISVVNRKVGIMTSSGEFVYIKANNAFTKVGEIHTGELYRKNLLIYKYAIIAASLMFIFISSVVAYDYYTPITTVVLSINPSVSIKANRWNKIISSKALNSDGLLILNNIKLKYKSIDDGLELLVEEAKTEDFINDKYIIDKKIINVDFESKKNSSIDISKFKNIVDSNNLSININSNLDTNKNIDITANNKKIDTSKFKNGSYKKNDSTETSNIGDNTVKKPSLNSNTNTKIITNKNTKTKTNKNTNTVEKKSSRSNQEVKKNNNENINKDTMEKNKSQDDRNKTIRNVDKNNGDNKIY